jgi:predicted RNA polymerase sigma factor
MSLPPTPHAQVLRRALALAATQPRNALELLTNGIDQARQQGDLHGISALARHAAVVSAHLGDTRMALSYYDEAVRHDCDDAYLHYACGSLRKQLGQVTEAHVDFTRALELARRQGDAEMIELATASLIA